MEFDAKGVPKWNQKRRQHSAKAYAKTCNEKEDQESHQKSYFSES